jgi:hypothetical protein
VLIDKTMDNIGWLDESMTPHTLPAKQTEWDPRLPIGRVDQMTSAQIGNKRKRLVAVKCFWIQPAEKSGCRFLKCPIRKRPAFR